MAPSSKSIVRIRKHLTYILCEFRVRVGWAAAATVAAVLGHRGHVMNRIQLWKLIPVPFYGPYTAETQAKMYYMWSASYLSLASHLGSMCLGVLAYLALSSTTSVRWLARSAPAHEL